MSQAGPVDIVKNHPEIPTQFDANVGSAIPIANILNIFGAVVSATGIPVETVASGMTVTTNVQLAIATGSSNVNNAGLASFDSADFSVDAHGYVTFTGSVGTESFTVDAHTVPGTNPVLPNGSGNITITGGQVAAGTTTNVIRTDSLAANTYTIEIQRSQAVGSSTIGDNGVSHFDSAAFDVDANGFVQLNGGGIASTAFEVQANTAPGTNPVVPTSAGLVNVNGAVVANHSVVLETRSRAANTYNLEVQYATSAAATDGTKAGVAVFDSAAFSVDASGFVTFIGGGSGVTSVGTQTGTNPIVPTGGGLITINGAVVAAGTHPVRSDGTGANTMAIEVQISQALAAADATKIGLSNFKSADFAVDANGFVSANATGYIRTITGTTGGAESPASGGNFNFAGATAAAGTTPVVVTGSANTETVKVQISQAIASTDITKVGLATFDSSSFGVDANGFVTFTGGGGSVTGIIGDYGSATTMSPVTFNAVTGGGGGVSNTGLQFTSDGSSLVSLDFYLPAGGGPSTFYQNMGFGPQNFTSWSGGLYNTFCGVQCMQGLSTGSYNCAYGFQAFSAASSDSNNSVFGYLAANTLSGGATNNVIVGDLSRLSGSVFSNTIIGSQSGPSKAFATNCIAIGFNAILNPGGNDNCIIIGTNPGASTQGSIVIGDSNTQTECTIAGISGGAGTTLPVFVDATGLLGTTVSSRKYKENITSIENSPILNLEPVSFNYKKSDDPKKASRTSNLQYGLIAEDVACICPELVNFKDGEPETVAYHLIPVLLLAEMKKMRKEIDKLKLKVGI